MNTPKLFELLYQTQQVIPIANGLKGREYGTQIGVVSDIKDPKKLRRIKAKFPNNPNLDSYWLYRLDTTPGVDAPLPLIGQTVAVTYLNGDPNSGFYFNLINDTNTPQDKESINRDYYIKSDGHYKVDSSVKITLTVGEATKIIINEGVITIQSETVNIESETLNIESEEVNINSPTVAFESDSVSINGKDVAVIGALDDGGDVLITSGL